MKTKQFVNRRASDYHIKRYLDLMQTDAEEDRIASALLACNYSRCHSATPVTQGLIQMDCVAACIVDGAIWVASNSRKITDEDIDNALGDSYTGRDVWIVVNGRGNMHAEMQLVKELNEANLLGKVKYIGVSKPCCALCSEVLNAQGINYIHWHSSPVKNWEPPY